jgi:TldD protein
MPWAQLTRTAVDYGEEDPMDLNLRFPDRLYADIRYEEAYSTRISFENGVLKQNKQKCDRGALIRLFDGLRWYYSATTGLERLQDALDELAAMAAEDKDALSHPIIQKLEIHRQQVIRYQATDIRQVTRAEKLALLKRYLPITGRYPEIVNSTAGYLDNHVLKHFKSSLGADVTYDYQNTAIGIRYDLSIDGKPQAGYEYLNKTDFAALAGQESQFTTTIEKDIAFLKAAIPVEPGTYTCILSPLVTGVFAHESFGHKSESDFMIGDETMMREWAIGSRVGAANLSIIDSGLAEGGGYVPFDDEGCQARENYLIRNGVLTGRLHSSSTAAALGEPVTGNARATTFEYEPIVRMTSTIVGGGDISRDELIAGTPLGIFIDNFKHGSGMTTFTIAPARAYMIRDGRLAEPVNISVITGNVMETLHQIDGIAREVEIFSSPTGGCGKMEQSPLRVSFGGPCIRVAGLNVR